MNFAQSALQGFGSTLSILDRIDARRARSEQNQINAAAAEKQDERNDLLFSQSQADRASRLAREEILTGRQDTAYDQSLSDNTLAREQQATLFDQAQEDRTDRRADQATERAYQAEQRAYQKELQPLQIKAERARISNQYSQSQLNDIQLAEAKQTQQANAAAAIYRESIAQLETGDTAGAYKTAQQLNDYGFDVDSLTDDTVNRATDITSKLVAGELDLDSDDAKWLAQQVLTPSLVQSGRDPERYKIDTIRPSTAGRFSVGMKDTKTGKTVPATLGQSSEQSDVLSEISIDDLVAASSQYISTAKTIAGMNPEKATALSNRLNSVGARLGARSTEKPLSAANRRENRLAQEARDEQARQPVNDFIDSYSQSPDKQAIALLLSNSEGFDLARAPGDIEQIASTIDDIGSPQAAVQAFFNARDIKEQEPVIAQQLRDRFPILNDEEAVKAAQRLGSGKWQLEDVERRADRLQKRADNDAANQARRDNRNTQPGPRGRATPVNSRGREGNRAPDTAAIQRIIKDDHPTISARDTGLIVRLIDSGKITTSGEATKIIGLVESGQLTGTQIREFITHNEQ